MDNSMLGSAVQPDHSTVHQQLSYLASVCNMAFLPLPIMLFLVEACLLCITNLGLVPLISLSLMIRWRDSDWRRLKVQWDFISDVHVLPERVSHWRIELIGVTKKRRIIAPNSNLKRAHPSDSSTTQIPFVLKKDILESLAGYTQQTQSGFTRSRNLSSRCF